MVQVVYGTSELIRLQLNKTSHFITQGLRRIYKNIARYKASKLFTAVETKQLSFYQACETKN